MWMTTYKFLRWIHSSRWMDERVVTSERSVGAVSRTRCGRSQKNWIGWEVNMSQCSRGDTLEEWADGRDGWQNLSEDRDGWRIGSERRGGMENSWRTSWWMENSWRTVVMNAKNWSEGCNGSVHIENWCMGHILQPSDGKLLKEYWWDLNRGCGSEVEAEIHSFFRYSFWNDNQYVKELMPLREGVLVWMSCYMRQHLADPRKTFIVERVCEDEIHDKADMQVECSKDAIRIEWIHVEDIGCFLKQLENQHSFGELLWKRCTGSLGDKLDESWYAYYVAGHEQSDTVGNDSEGVTWTS